LPNVGPYIYDVSISGFTRSSIYIYDISSLRVKVMNTDLLQCGKYCVSVVWKVLLGLMTINLLRN